MVSVLLLCRYDRLGASSRLRFLDFVKPLAERGIAVTPLPFFDDAYLRALYAGQKPDPLKLARAYTRRLGGLFRARRFDVVWLEKEALPWLPVWVEKAFLRDTPYVMDIDDAWYLRYAARRLLKEKFARLARGAAVVAAGNPYLAAWAEGCGAVDTAVVPTVIDIGRYPRTPPAANPLPVIGWMGTPSSAGYLHSVAAALARMDGRARLRVVGIGPADLPPGLRADCAPWSEDGEVAELAGFDIGIMPLPDTPWERGKCGYKLIQYMALGRPVVASPVGVNTEIVRDGENGLLATGNAEWEGALNRLVSDSGLRAAMGNAGRATVEARYTLQAVLPQLEGILRRAAG